MKQQISDLRQVVKQLQENVRVLEQKSILNEDSETDSEAGSAEKPAKPAKFEQSDDFAHI